MDSFSSSLLIRALDGLSARSVAIAQNVANANTAGYRPIRVTFEAALQRAAGLGADAVRGVKPKIETDGAADSLRLDLEMAAASSVSHRYGALVEVLNRQLQLQAIAIRGSI